MTQNKQNRGGGKRGGNYSDGNSNFKKVIGPNKEEVQKFIQENKSAPEMIKSCEIFGKALKNNKVTTTQLRNAYGSMKKVEMEGWNEQTKVKVLLIKPRLAYAAGRHKGGMQDLSRVMNDAIDAIKDKDDFQRFCHFFEAIVAYFKAAGGK